jgi:hypothetical protein
MVLCRERERGGELGEGGGERRRGRGWAAATGGGGGGGRDRLPTGSLGGGAGAPGSPYAESEARE